MASIPLLDQSPNREPHDDQEDDSYKDQDFAEEGQFGSSRNSPKRSPLPKTSPNLSLIFICIALLLCGAGLELTRHTWADSHSISAAKARLADLAAETELARARLDADQQDFLLGNATLDPTKLAVIIEKRDLPVLVPVLLDFLIKVPASWPFQLWTSEETAAAVGSSRHIKPYVDSGKLDLRLLPDNGDHIFSGETLSAFLTAPYWWQELAPAEHIFFFQADSILCTKSEFTVDDFLGLNDSRNGHEGWAWVGAPWDLRGYPAPPSSGNGGLSLRRRSVMLNVTTNYEWDGSAEDLWFNAKIQEYANGTSLFPDQDLAMRFSYESLPKQAQGLDWAYEAHGIHIGTGWAVCKLGGWERIDKVLEWCPEAKMIIPNHCLRDERLVSAHPTGDP